MVTMSAKLKRLLSSHPKQQFFPFLLLLVKGLGFLDSSPSVHFSDTSNNTASFLILMLRRNLENNIFFVIL